MTKDEFEDRKNLTFKQAEGVEPLPHQLSREEVSPALRAQLWSLFFDSLSKNSERGMYERHVGAPWRVLLEFKHVYRDHAMADEFNSEFAVQCKELKRIFKQGDYLEIFDFLQWYLQLPHHPVSVGDISDVLTGCRTAWRIVGERIIVPITSNAERQSLERAYADLKAKEFAGAQKHLSNAAQQLTAGNYPGSIRESIHSVESVARSITDKSSLKDALVEIEKIHKMHPALKKGFGALYGFTSDEKGIRHPLLESGAAQVDEVDAIFMIGACAAFVSYLINRRREARS